MMFLSKKKSLLIAAAMSVSFLAAPLTPGYAAEPAAQTYTQKDLNDEMIMAAAWMLGTMKILSYLPVLLIAGIVTGMAIGIVAGQILNRIKMLS